MIVALLLAVAAATPAEQVDAAYERIGVAAMIRCPKSNGDEVVVCGRASARDRFLLPLPPEAEIGSRRIENALAERAHLAAIGKYSTPSTVGPGGEDGWTLHAISEAVGESVFTPLHRRFEGPDVEIVKSR